MARFTQLANNYRLHTMNNSALLSLTVCVKLAKSLVNLNIKAQTCRKGMDFWKILSDLEPLGPNKVDLGKILNLDTF